MRAARGRGRSELQKALAAALLALIAIMLWASRDVVSSWFATFRQATIELTTTTESDDARVKRAFAAGSSASPSEATLESVPGLRQIRHSVVHVTGPSHEAAISAAESLSQATVAAFDAEGPGHLEARVLRRTYPVPGSESQSVLGVAALGAPALGLSALALLWLSWRNWPAGADGMSREAVFGAIGIGVMGVLPFIMPGWVFMALFAMAVPGAVSATVVYKMREVRRAELWPSAQGRIVRSEMRALRRQHAGDATTVSNLPDVEYVYTVDGVEHRGHRIGIGDIAASSPEAEALLERYHVGRTGPVYYNPDKPDESVLERSPPARPAVVYGIAAGAMLVGLTVVVAFTRADQIIDWLQPYFPRGAVVPGALFCTAAGFLMTLFLASNWRSAVAAARWPTTMGTVLSSIAESRRKRIPGGRGQIVIVWSPVVEYRYRVRERDYHGSRLAFGGDAAGPRDFAEAIAARYPTGGAVTVHFDPANPAFAVLQARVAFAWPTLIITVAFFAAAVFFSGWRGFS